MIPVLSSVVLPELLEVYILHLTFSLPLSFCSMLISRRRGLCGFGNPEWLLANPLKSVEPPAWPLGGGDFPLDCRVWYPLNSLFKKGISTTTACDWMAIHMLYYWIAHLVTVVLCWVVSISFQICYCYNICYLLSYSWCWISIVLVPLIGRAPLLDSSNSDMRIAWMDEFNWIMSACGTSSKHWLTWVVESLSVIHGIEG
jgi:hypothetical protein